jgi:hypothetical protein
VLHFILIAPIPAGRITPIMLGDEFFFRTDFDGLRLSLAYGFD